METEYILVTNFLQFKQMGPLFLHGKLKVNQVYSSKNNIWLNQKVSHFAPGCAKFLRCYFMGRSRHPEVFLLEGVLKLCSKFTGEHPCRSVISINLQSNFIEIILRHGCSLVNLLHIFRTTFTKNTSERLLLFGLNDYKLNTAFSH